MGLGTGVSVAGVFAYNILGTLSVKYTIDGVAATQNYSVTPTTPEYMNGVKQRNHFPLFGKNSLRAGDHTLVMEIMDCVNQTFELDYVLYTPSFSSLASKQGTTGTSQPIFQLSSLTVSSSQGNSSATSNGLLLPSSTLSSSSTQSASTTAASTKKTSQTAAVIAGVVGGIGLLLLFLFIIFRKKIFTRLSRTSSQPAETSGTYILSLNTFITSV